MSLHVKEHQINRTENYSFGDPDVYETYFEKLGDLYKSCLKEFGRCVSKMYVDGADGQPQQIGWVFLKKSRYQDDPSQKFLQETWVSVHTAKDTVVRSEHFYPFP